MIRARVLNGQAHVSIEADDHGLNEIASAVIALLAEDAPVVTVARPHLLDQATLSPTVTIQRTA